MSAAVCALSDDYILLSRITPTNFDRSIPPTCQVWNENVRKKDLFYIVWYKRGILYYEGAGKKKDIEKLIWDKKTDIEIPSGGSTIVLFRLDTSIFTKEELESMQVNIQNLQYFLLIQEKFYGKKKVVIDVEGSQLTGSGFNGFGYDLLKEITPADTSSNQKIGLYISIGYDEELGPKQECGSVNSLTVDSGVHIQYVENAFARALKENYGIKHRYTTTGLKLCVVALAPEVVFSSQTKEKLKSFTKVREADFGSLVKEFQKLFRKYPEYWDKYVEKLNYLADSMKSLSASEKAQKIIDDAAGRGIYKAKGEMIEGFADATAPTGDRWNCEAFIVEGLSPGGSLKAARKSTKYTAIIPLRGKVKNVKDSNADQVMDNKELFTIFKLIGLGIDVNNVTKGCKTSEEAYEKIKQYSRYGKIVISTDADEDGLQIQNGLLYAISKFARFMLDFGLIYIAESPIFEQDGKYFYPSDPRIPGTQFCVGMNPNKHYRRFKGLGSLDREDVYDAFYDETKRRLFRVTTDGIKFSMELVENIEARKELLRNKNILTNPYNFTDL